MNPRNSPHMLKSGVDYDKDRQDHYCTQAALAYILMVLDHKRRVVGTLTVNRSQTLKYPLHHVLRVIKNIYPDVRSIVWLPMTIRDERLNKETIH